jgi:RNA polymerase sigma-70 factor, ECF subfamily
MTQSSWRASCANRSSLHFFLRPRSSFLDEVTNISGWMYRLTRTALADHYRAQGKGSTMLEQVVHESQSETGLVEAVDVTKSDTEPPGADLATCIEGLRDEIPETYGEAIRLTELGELSQKEAAADLGLSVSVSGMKSRVQRGRAMLRKFLLTCCDVELDARRGVMGYKRRKGCSCDPR